MDYLRGIHAPEKQKRLSQKLKSKVQKLDGASDYARSFRESTNFTTLDDLERWEQEEQTWHLLGLMLQVEYPSCDSNQRTEPFDERLVRPSKGTEVHQYSSENDVWTRFLAHDDQAWERHTVVEWLKTCASESGQDIEKVFQDLEAGADRGSGLWAHSWLYTKEAIKGQKRLRSWPQALAPDSPGLDASLRSSDGSTGLVTELDPDAVTRQVGAWKRQMRTLKERPGWPVGRWSAVAKTGHSSVSGVRSG